MKLYNSMLSPYSARVRIALYAKNLPCEITSAPGGTGSAEFKRLNPIGKVPALEDAGAVVAESEVICEYLEGRYPAPALMPAGHRLAFWVYGNLVTGGDAPYFDMPATSMDTYGRSGRGYVQGRFRGQRMAYGELEYRWTVKRNGLLGIVAFLNTETFSNKETGERLFDSFDTGAGVGLRLMMNKRSKTNLAFDVGRGNDGKGRVYFAIQEAF